MQSLCAICNRCFLSCCPERIYLGGCFNTNIYNFLYKHLLVPLVVSAFTLTSLQFRCECMEKCRTHRLGYKDMQVSSSMKLFPTLLSHAIDQCDLSYLYTIKLSFCCLQRLLCLTPKYWNSLLPSAHISPYNGYALLNKHHAHSISQPALLRLSLFTWNFALFQRVLIIILCSYFLYLQLPSCFN